MNEESEEWVIRRILVGLDLSGHSLVALETAVELASQLEAELVGLFVEDANLLRLAGLPFAVEQGLFSGTRRCLDTEQLERQFRAQEQRLRHGLEAFALQSQIRWSFEVRRGSVTSELLSSASGADLVVVGRAGGAAGRVRGLGSTARGVAASATCAALLVSRDRSSLLPVSAIFDGSPLSQKALTIAVRLLKARGGHLTVFLLPADECGAVKLKAQAEDWLQGHKVPTRYVVCSTRDPAKLVHEIRHEGCGTLVLPGLGALLSQEQVLLITELAERPVLLVR